VADVKEGKGTLGRLLKDEELSKEVDQIVSDVRDSTASLKKAAERIDKGEGVLGKLIMDDRMAKDMDALVADARTLTENLRTISDDLRKGEGTVGKLLHSDELYNKVNDSFTTISDTVKLFKDGEGLLPKLLSDKKMADDLQALVSDARQAAADLKDITGKVRSGDSTVGKLLESDDVYKKLTQLMDSVQGIVDTYREQSPVITLAGAIFGAF
jgi:phospholipid/cholesterol/gamma-HCH transport system substrate-binding protein